MIINNTELTVTGKFFRIAKLKHEWCEYLADPFVLASGLSQTPSKADVLTFINEVNDQSRVFELYKETASAAVLPISSYDSWWEHLGFKVRNKIRKAIKSGVEVRIVDLTDKLAEGVAKIYNESPVRQGKKFWHYGKSAEDIKQDLSPFLDRSIFLAAYHDSELIGFAKLYCGENILRTIHILAKLSARDKPVMDLLIAKAVEYCGQNGIQYLQYGSWSQGGLGAFKEKHGFQHIKIPRYFVPITLIGKIMLQFGLHRSFKERLPEQWKTQLVSLRGRYYSLKYQLYYKAKKYLPNSFLHNAVDDK